MLQNSCIRKAEGDWGVCLCVCGGMRGMLDVIVFENPKLTTKQQREEDRSVDKRVGQRK